LTPGSGGGGGESAVAAAQGYYHLKLIHAQVTVPAPPGVEHTVDLVEIDGRTAEVGNAPVAASNWYLTLPCGSSKPGSSSGHTPGNHHDRRAKPGSSQLELRTALVTRELARYKVGIAVISETRFSEQGQLEMGAGYTFFWSSRPKAERRDAGAAFAIRNEIMGRLPYLPQSINDRLMSLRLAPGRQLRHHHHHLEQGLLPESQLGFRRNRRNTHVIFAAR
uniref:Beta-tubulin n=1 Tax=Schistocephalus solidus TaxID=70667 RepID=A0A183T1C6_SCHSO